MFKKEIIGNCELYLGNCLEILPSISYVDALISDPPYGVNLGENNKGQAIAKSQMPYENFSDTPEYIRNTVVPAIELALKKSKRGLITPGNRNIFFYPSADDIGVWFNPASQSFSKWGFNLIQIILYYGKNPYPNKGISPTSITGHFNNVSDIKNKIHPCPKPVKFMKWAINKASLENETILDPFMGVGTTGLACIDLHRKFIGIEIEQKYFDFACKSIEKKIHQLQFDF